MRLHSDFSAAFCVGTRFVNRAGTTRDVSVKEVGMIDLPSGRLSLLYPGNVEAAGPFEQTVNPGRYPVEVSVVDGGLACVRVRLQAGVPVRWELALRAGEDASTLSKHEFFGCWAGALGCLCIADETARAELDCEDEPPAVITAALADPESIATCLTLEDESEITLFNTGGSGTFAAYWGWSAEGQLLEFVVDLGELIENDWEEANVPVVGSVGDTLALPGRLGQAGRIVIAERSDRLRLLVEQRNGELELRGFSQRRASGEAPMEYDFPPNTKAVHIVGFLGHVRWSSLGPS
jgi:hypothetical protein